MKLPSIQFYPGDWRKDPGVQALTFEERGVWMEILFMMHESEQPGRLMLGGKPYPIDRLARVFGLSPSYLEVIITSLITLNVASVCETTGALMSRRMVRDREISSTRSTSGRKGGNPNFKKGESNPYYNNQNDKQKDNPPHKQKDKQKITPSSSSSSSPSGYTPISPQGGDGRVDEFADDPELLPSPPPPPPGPNGHDRFLPANWKRMGRTERKTTKVLKNSPMMQTIGSWFGRRPETLWTVDEAATLMRLKPQPPEVAGMGKYYESDIPKDDDIRRRDLATLLNNWSGELDRARAYDISHP